MEKPGEEAMISTSEPQTNEKRLRKILLFTLVLTSLIILLSLLSPPGQSTHAAAELSITPITWNVIGLDSVDVFSGSNIYPVGARVCNIGSEVATNVIVDFIWTSTNPYIELSGTNSQSLPSLNASVCRDFYFNVAVTRNAAAYMTARKYQNTASADGIGAVSTPTDRELYVQALSRNENQNLGELSGPTSVMVGGTYQYTLTQSTIPTQQQLQHFINFPTNIFEIISVAANYSVPQGGTNNKPYADACGWENNPNATLYLLCVGPAPAEYPNGIVGGTVSLTYTVRVRSTGSAVLSSFIYGFDEGTFSYQYSQDPSTLFVNVISQNTETPTATLTQTLTNTPTITGTAPTSTATATSTITGTPPTSTATFTGTPPTPTATGTITPGMTITKAANVTSVRPGDTIVFTIKVGNSGTAPATNVTISDTFQSALNISSVTTTKGTYTVNTSTRTVTVDLENIAPGQSSAITVTARVNTTVTSTTTFTNFARLTYVFGSITYSENSNNVSYVVVISSTLPGTGLSSINPDNGDGSGYFIPVLILSLILGVLGLGTILLGARNKQSNSQWANWFIKTGLILISASIAFGLIAIIIKPGVNLASFFQGSQNSKATDESASAWRPTPEGPFILLATPTELDTLPDYPIPTPDIQMTPNSGEPAPDVSPINRIYIPAIELDTIVKYVPFEGLTWLISGLKQEVAWMGDTSWPGLGGNTGLAGHVTLRDGRDGPFRYLGDLNGGELINLYTEENVYSYQVRAARIVEDNDFSVITKTDYSQLTLITCTEWDKDLGIYLKRIVVFADLVEVEPIRQLSQSN